MLCFHRDICPCHGPIPLCSHHHYGDRFGKKETRNAADGSDMTVFLVTEDDCKRCDYPGKTS